MTKEEEPQVIKAICDSIGCRGKKINVEMCGGAVLSQRRISLAPCPQQKMALSGPKQLVEPLSCDECQAETAVRIRKNEGW